MRKLVGLILVLPLAGCDYIAMVDASPKAETGHAPSYQVGKAEVAKPPAHEAKK